MSTGSSTLNLTLKRATVTAGLNGLQGQAPYFQGALGTGPTSVEPTANSLTVSFWVRFSVVGNCTILTKYYASTWTSPFAAIYFAISSGNWIVGINISGALRQTTIADARYAVKAGEWVLFAMTYDGSVARYYLNGVQASSDTVSGSIAFGTHGPWDVGGQSTGENGLVDGMIEDVRVESTVRSAAYLRAMYRTAMLLS